jgi:hypothetical protein
MTIMENRKTFIKVMAALGLAILFGGLLGSQNAMTGLVAALRLIPFVSFDIVSYAAGLTPLKHGVSPWPAWS